MNIFDRNSAFTLAEVLITLGVLGVVAAMTMPALIANHQEKVLIEQLNVTYAQLLQATRLIVQDKNGGIDNIWGNKPIHGFIDLLPKYMNVTEVKRNRGNYFRTPDGGTKSFRIDRAFALPSGAEISFDNTQIDTVVSNEEGYQGQCNLDSNFKINGGNTKGNTYFNACGHFLVDVNGFNKPPNMFEKDVFTFYLVIDGVIPAGMPKDGVWCQIFDPVKYANCAGWVIIHKNMDYLRCPEKLGWDKASSCK